MEWSDVIIPMVRNMTGDTDSSNYTFCDADLQLKIITAINLMQLEIDFAVDYTADIVGMTITPDPATAPADNDFMTLAALKTACLIERSDVSKLTSQDIQQLTDNGFTMKIGDVGASKIEALKINWCVAYGKAKADFESGNGILGKAIVSPFPAFGDRWAGGLGYGRSNYRGGRSTFGCP